MTNWLPQEQGHYQWDTDKWVPAKCARIELLVGTRKAVLSVDHAYRSKAGKAYFALAGMLFDGGSKPRFSWPLFGHPWNEYILDYIIHDALRGEAMDKFKAGHIVRKGYAELMREADYIFKESQRWTMENLLRKESSECERAKIRIKYKAVRLHAWYRLLTDRRHPQKRK